MQKFCIIKPVVDTLKKSNMIALKKLGLEALIRSVIEILFLKT